MPQKGAPLHPVASAEWLASRTEEILEPGVAIVDPHVHLWGPPRSPYLPAQFAADASGGHNVVATLYAECSEAYRTDGPEELRSVGETEHAARLARAAESDPATRRWCAGIISWTDLRGGARMAEVLRAHAKAAGGRLRGIRQSSAWDRDPETQTLLRPPPRHLLRDPAFREGFARLQPAGLVFDAWCYYHQLPELTELARAFPTQPIVIDHVGGPIGIGAYAGRRDEVFSDWSTAMRDLASCPNVSVKLGGLAMKLPGFGFHTQARPPSSQELADAWRPYIETCIEVFGPQRSMFESNFPVDRISCSYAVLWNAFKRIAAGCSADDKEALFGRTAARVYSIEI
jgi:predicted TIM-barrel fold metal-dependent hydrolase